MARPKSASFRVMALLKNVLWLDVPVDDPSGVEVLQQAEQPVLISALSKVHQLCIRFEGHWWGHCARCISVDSGLCRVSTPKACKCRCCYHIAAGQQALHHLAIGTCLQMLCLTARANRYNCSSALTRHMSLAAMHNHAKRLSFHTGK